MNRKTFIQFGTIVAVAAYVKPTLTPIQANAMMVSPISTNPPKVTITHEPTKSPTQRETPNASTTPGNTPTVTKTGTPNAYGTITPSPTGTVTPGSSSTATRAATASSTPGGTIQPSSTPIGGTPGASVTATIQGGQTPGPTITASTTPTVGRSNEPTGTPTVVTTSSTPSRGRNNDNGAGSSSSSRNQSGNDTEIRINSDYNPHLTISNGQRQDQETSSGTVAQPYNPVRDGLVFPGHAVVPPLFVARPSAHGTPAVPGQLPNAGDGNPTIATAAGIAAVGAALFGAAYELMRNKKNDKAGLQGRNSSPSNED